MINHGSTPLCFWPMSSRSMASSTTCQTLGRRYFVIGSTTLRSSPSRTPFSSNWVQDRILYFDANAVSTHTRYSRWAQSHTSAAQQLSISICNPRTQPLQPLVCQGPPSRDTSNRLRHRSFHPSLQSLARVYRHRHLNIPPLPRHSKHCLLTHSSTSDPRLGRWYRGYGTSSYPRFGRRRATSFRETRRRCNMQN